ncbi:MAG: hypothetical protein WB699_15425, partial [Bacteroidota bacterium]
LKTSADSAAWSSEKKRIDLWNNETFGEEDLLPYVQRYLNPPPGVPATACVWIMKGDALQSPEGLGTKAAWSLHTPRHEIRFEILGVEMLLFRAGIGFLSFRVRCFNETEEDWMDFLHFGRYIKKKHGVTVRLERKIGKDQVVPYFPPQAGGAGAHPEGEGTFSDIITAILKTSGGDRPEWWREVFVAGQMIPYAAIFADGLSPDDTSLLLFRLRHFFGMQQLMRPAPEDLSLSNPSLLPYSEGQWFVFSLDGTAFIAANPPDTVFLKQTMPDHLRDRYFLLFLIVLHQRFALMDLSDRVAHEWLRGDELGRAAAFERIRDALLQFTARGYFSQVMQTEHHHTVYRRWQDTFQVELLYREVNDEVREMHGSLMLRRTEKLQELAEEQRKRDEAEAKVREAQEKRVESWFARITFLLGVPAVVLGFLQTEAAVGMPVSLAAAGAAFVLGAIAIYLKEKYLR